MTFSRKVMIGLVSGLAVGLFLGDVVAPVKIVRGRVHQVAADDRPAVRHPLHPRELGIAGRGAGETPGLRAGAVLLGLWAVALTFAMLFPLAFPSQDNASFFSTSLVEKRRTFDFVDLYIPSNPFHSLANGVVPAVVLFAVVLGVA